MGESDKNNFLQKLVTTVEGPLLTASVSAAGTYFLFGDGSMTASVAGLSLPVSVWSGIATGAGSYVADMLHSKIMAAVPIGASTSTTYMLENQLLNPLLSGAANTLMMSALFGFSGIESMVKPFLLGAGSEFIAEQIEKQFGSKSST